ncbi:dihydrofolate reductase family protein [Hyalangium rubrum]|uniref:Dihydrofolate reductase family protein n=1 Tax=Hyalangium rubrum TaxID=3103134 RepID=A0ABU5H5G3_9BACT|nr:dihydrofolate reductase family protein [Hyalangium sp. s54d21]MDY7228104.1 dihydrofolate reductase family protein [Hyalangium sp. s54d21]
MKKLKYHVASTLDGFIATEQHTAEAFMQDRLVKDSEHVADYLASFASYDTVLMGRRTYEVGLKLGVTDPYPALETYVFSHSMKESPNPRVKLITEDSVGVVRRLKEQQGKDLYLCGGGEFAATLLTAGLVDEVLVKLNPLLLGSGIPLATRLKEVKNLELLSTKVYKNGVVLLRYSVLG